MRKAATVIKERPTELNMGRRQEISWTQASMNPEQLTSISTKQNLLNKEIQKLAMKTHLEVRQREDIELEPASRERVVPTKCPSSCSSWRLYIYSKSDFNSSATVSAICADQ